MQEKTKVLMIHRIYAAYRKPIYDKLAEAYDFLILHGDKEATIQQAKTYYSKIIKSFQYTSNPTNLIFQSFTDLFRIRPKAVIHESSIGILSLLPMYVCSKLLGAKFLLYGHGYNRFNTFNPKKNWADKYRVMLMKLADAIIIYTKTDKNMLGQYIDKSKIFVAQNTLDNTDLAEIRHNLEQEGRAQVKQRVGFTHKYNLTYIGRILPEKMPEKILDVFEILNKKMPGQIGVHFVGGGDIEPLKKIVEANKWQNDVKFHGSIYDDNVTGAYLYASDLMIMPGYLGLAVNHAFMLDCPVISFEQTEIGPFHSPEIEYVVENETGFLIPDLSVDKMADKIFIYLRDSFLQNEMKKHIRLKMDTDLTTDNMVKGFTDAIDYVLNKKNAESVSHQRTPQLLN